MQVILLERIEKLGGLGDIVSVKPGYARNFLLPQNKALRATQRNLEYFESQRAQIEEENAKRRAEAEGLGTSVDGESFVIIRQAGESGQLYGSVSARDIAAAAAERGFTVDRRQVAIDRPIKTLGVHTAKVVLHPEVIATITINVAQSQEEAESQARAAAAGEPVDPAPAPRAADKSPVAADDASPSDEGPDPDAETETETADADPPKE